MTKRRHNKKVLTRRFIGVFVTFVIILVCVSIPILNPKKVEEPELPKDLLIESIMKSEPYQAAVQYPVINNETVDKTVRLFVDDQIERYESQRDSDLEELNIRFDVCSFNDKFISYVFHTYSLYDYDAHGTTELHSFTFDKDTGYLVSLTDLFESEADYSSFKTTLAEDFFKKSEDSLYDSVEETSVALNTALDTSPLFSFDNKSLNIHFQTYSLAPGYLGPQTVSLPLDSINGLKITSTDNPSEDLGKPAVDTYEKESRLEYLQSLENTKFVALTFDDGPHPELTPKLLDTLKAKDAKVTFFILGSHSNHYSEIIQRAYSEGHQIASHTMNHRNLTNLTQEEMNVEILDTESAIINITGKKPTLMRPPYGAYNDQVRNTSTAAIALWSVDPEDWKVKDPVAIANSVIADSKDGSVILLHDIHESSVDAASTIVDTLQDQGYTFVTMEELILLKGTYDSNEIYYGF